LNTFNPKHTHQVASCELEYACTDLPPFATRISLFSSLVTNSTPPTIYLAHEKKKKKY
jgi:hypothetical protein